jgi:hypothetical protein
MCGEITGELAQRYLGRRRTDCQVPEHSEPLRMKGRPEFQTKACARSLVCGDFEDLAVLRESDPSRRIREVISAETCLAKNVLRVDPGSRDPLAHAVRRRRHDQRRLQLPRSDTPGVLHGPTTA